MDLYALLYLAVLTFMVKATNEPIRIPLKTMVSPLQYLMAHAHKPQYKGLIKELEALHDSQHTIPLFKFLDSEFFGDVRIGHQPFKVIFDTSWADLWVPSILCSAINIACNFKNKYDASHSATYMPTNKTYFRYMKTYNLTGKISMDVINIGGLNITNQTFAELDSLPWSEFLLSKADGVFGLSFDTYAADGITPFFYNLIKQKKVPKQVFSFYMNRDLITKKGGSILLGDIDKKHYNGNMSYVRVDPNTGFWQIPVDGISIPGPDKKTRTFCNGGCSAIIDTSSNKIRGPKEDIDMINGLINARKFLFGRSIVDCGIAATLPHVTITIGKKPYVLKGKDFVQQMNYGPVTICLSSFTTYETDGPVKWIFGGAFMSKYYTVFDMEYFQVGFALANR